MATTIILILIGMTAAIGSPWLVRHRHRLIAELSRGSMSSTRRRKAIKRRSEKNAPKSEYECVTVRRCLEGCAAVTQQQNRRYLLDEAPELPLPGCDSEECQCRYQYHKDRRENEDRRFKLAQFNTVDARLGGEERRSVKRSDRRKADQKPEARSYFNDY